MKILTIIFSIIVFLVILFFAYSSDFIDYMIAKSLPKYPGATDIRINSTSGFPDSSASAVISFKTNDKAKEVISYYMNYLEKYSWQRESSVIEKKPDYGGTIVNNSDLKLFSQAFYIKEILGIHYKIQITAFDLLEEELKKKAGTSEIPPQIRKNFEDERIYIFITH